MEYQGRGRGMEKFVKGDVVVFPFPFSDLSSTKKRPALVISVFEGNDLLLCQITSQIQPDIYSIKLNDSDFKAGSLNLPSFIRGNKLLTADKYLIEYKIGSIKDKKLEEVVDSICDIIKN